MKRLLLYNAGSHANLGDRLPQKIYEEKLAELTGLETLSVNYQFRINEMDIEHFNDIGMALVLAGGGQLMVWHDGTPLFTCEDEVLFEKLRIPIYIIGCGFNRPVSCKVSKRALKANAALLNYCHLVGLRTQSDIRIAKRLGCLNAQLSPDPLTFIGEEADKVTGLVASCLAPDDMPILAQLGLKEYTIAPIVHDPGQDADIEEYQRYFPCILPCSIKHYKTADFVIGRRFHTVVLAFAHHKPFFGYWYNLKTFFAEQMLYPVSFSTRTNGVPWSMSNLASIVFRYNTFLARRDEMLEDWAERMEWLKMTSDLFWRELQNAMSALG